jgi:hypothetical protein
VFRMHPFYLLTLKTLRKAYAKGQRLALRSNKVSYQTADNHHNKANPHPQD